jgi:transketolase
VIGYGAPHKQGTADTHGAPLGEDEIAAAREELGWHHPPFEVPEAVCEAWDARERGVEAEADWDRLFERYQQAHPEAAAEYRRVMAGELPADWAGSADAAIATIAATGAKVATRKASQIALNAFAPHLPELVGGSADLTGSNNTWHDGSRAVTAEDASGNYVYFGVREFAMTAISNGMALHGGLRPYCGTFLVFSDYARNAVRMASLMKVPAILVYTHDSIGLGEDGPTHQPVEHLASLRLIPGMDVWRPCDTVETAVAWRAALERADGPTSLVLTRQGLPHQERSAAQVDAIARGAYVLRDGDGEPDIIFIATGSEVALATGAAEILSSDGLSVRVVSMPSCEVFDRQDEAWRESVLPPAVTRRVAIEAGATQGWWRYVGSAGAVIGIDRFGESAPAAELFEKFGFSVENVVAVARRLSA